MNEVLRFLKQVDALCLSTVGLDKNPRARPFQLMLEKQGKLYFCTSSKKEVYKELRENPQVELCASGPNLSWIRVSAKICFSDDQEIKKEIQQIHKLVRTIHEEPDNSDFKVFYLEKAQAVIADLDGRSPEKHQL